MTTYAEARAELASALEEYQDATGEGEPPTCLVFGNGGDLRLLMQGKVSAEFRITVVAPGQWSDGATSRTLGGQVVEVITEVRALAGWQVLSFTPDVVRDIGGSQYLTADVICRRNVDI